VPSSNLYHNNKIFAQFEVGFDQFKLDVDITIPSQGVTAIFGHSGSGKTTLLRCIAGLQKSESGKLIVNNQIWQDNTRFLLPHLRPIAYVFQDARLFPHLNVEENLNFALKRARKRSASFLLDIKSSGNVPLGKKSLDKIIAMFDILSLLKRYPENLSGGEKQRVAIARALFVNPELLLMDEPLASLDEKRKQEIIPFLEQLRYEFNIPIIYVSHSVAEVARLADNVIVLHEGAVDSQGNATEILNRQQHKLDAELGVIIEGTVVEHDNKWNLAHVQFDTGKLFITNYAYTLGQVLRLHIKAKDISITLSQHHDTSILNILPAKIINIYDASDSCSTLVELSLGRTTLVVKITKRSFVSLNLEKNKEVWVQIKSVALVR